ncbi:MAG: sodium:alanine symporter family protein [Clostridia bacterium]|nr:sodium:alanine symporter family protein [Clostridia bacterium]
MDVILKIVQTVNAYLSDYILIFLLVGIGIFYTVKTRFVQVRCFGEGFRRVFGNFTMKGGKQKGGISSFQALATAIAAQVGTGNIVGACGAILLGGPGAIFWMWVIAFFGMATNYSEAVLAQKTRLVGEDGSVAGGPVYYIKKAFNNKFGNFLAGFFATAVILALGFMGSMVQSNSIAENFTGAVSKSFGIDIPGWVIGIILAVFASFIFVGGIQRIASVTEKMVPIMAGLYIVGGLLVLGLNFKSIPEAFVMIFKYAFVPNAIIGGSIGYALKQAISQGAKRGLFSNEAGMGSTPHAHAMANVKDPHEQGVTAIIAVFIDTFVVLTMTAMVVITTLYTKGGILENGVAPVGVDKTNMVQIAFTQTFAKLFGEQAGQIIGSLFVAVCLFFFAFSTILGWNFFGKVNANYLFGKKSTLIYSIISVAFIFLGTCLSNDLVWELTDMFNNLMVIPNVIAMFALSSLVVSSVKFKKKKEIDATKNQ